MLPAGAGPRPTVVLGPVRVVPTGDLGGFAELGIPPQHRDFRARLNVGAVDRREREAGRLGLPRNHQPPCYVVTEGATPETPAYGKRGTSVAKRFRPCAGYQLARVTT